jgi:hypothetical protein
MMRFLTGMFAVSGLLAGLYYAMTSLTAQIMTGEHAAVLACACFLFVIALGVWRDDDTNGIKRTNYILEELVKRTPKRTPPPDN